MTAKRIAFTRPDGGVSVIVPIPKPGETEEQTLARCVARNIAVGNLQANTPTATIDASELPSRRFRNQWRKAGRTVAPDPTLCREQVIAEVRAERNAKLTASDADKARLDDLGTEQQKANLATYRQALRDLPATVYDPQTQRGEIASLTLEQLETYSPTWPET